MLRIVPLVWWEGGMLRIVHLGYGAHSVHNGVHPYVTGMSERERTTRRPPFLRLYTGRDPLAIRSLFFSHQEERSNPAQRDLLTITPLGS